MASMKDEMRQQGYSKEDEYFFKKDQELIEKMRLEHERKLLEIQEKTQLAAMEAAAGREVEVEKHVRGLEVDRELRAEAARESERTKRQGNLLGAREKGVATDGLDIEALDREATLQQGHEEILGALSEIGVRLNAPRTIVKDENGRIAGAQIEGGPFMRVNRGADGVESITTE